VCFRARLTISRPVMEVRVGLVVVLIDSFWN
jgi:hypothetical protein